MTFRKLSFVSKSRRETHIVLAGLRMSMYHVQCIRMSLPYFVPPWTMNQYEPVNIEIRGLWAERSCSMLFDVVRCCSIVLWFLLWFQVHQGLPPTISTKYGHDLRASPWTDNKQLSAGLCWPRFPLVSVWTSVHHVASLINTCWKEASMPVGDCCCMLSSLWGVNCFFNDKPMRRFVFQGSGVTDSETSAPGRCAQLRSRWDVKSRQNLSLWWVEDSRGGHSNWDGEGRNGMRWVEHGWTW